MASFAYLYKTLSSKNAKDFMGKLIKVSPQERLVEPEKFNKNLIKYLIFL